MFHKQNSTSTGKINYIHDIFMTKNNLNKIFSIQNISNTEDYMPKLLTFTMISLARFSNLWFSFSVYSTSNRVL